MPNLPLLDEIIDMMKELKAERPKSKQGVKVAGRRARKILAKIHAIYPGVRRELRDSVVYPIKEPLVSGTAQVSVVIPVEPPVAKQPLPTKQSPMKEQHGKYLDLGEV